MTKILISIVELVQNKLNPEYAAVGAVTQVIFVPEQ